MKARRRCEKDPSSDIKNSWDLLSAKDFAIWSIRRRLQFTEEYLESMCFWHRKEIHEVSTCQDRKDDKGTVLLLLDSRQDRRTSEKAQMKRDKAAKGKRVGKGRINKQRKYISGIYFFISI